jgi:hypothetical protein
MLTLLSPFHIINNSVDKPTNRIIVEPKEIGMTGRMVAGISISNNNSTIVMAAVNMAAAVNMVEEEAALATFGVEEALHVVVFVAAAADHLDEEVKDSEAALVGVDVDAIETFCFSHALDPFGLKP